MRRSGFSLVEVVIALGITAFSLVAVFGLLPVALNTNRDSVQQTEAADLLSLLEADIRSAPRGPGAISPALGVRIPDHPTPAAVTLGPIFMDEGGTAVSSAASAKFRVSLTFGPAHGRNATPVQILVTWPPEALSDLAIGRLSCISTIDRN
jgi:type II secretory pathway pseudopilin PulG